MNLNTKFEFDGKLRITLIVGMVIGLISLLASLIGDDAYNTRFWTNYLHNSVYFTGIAFMAIFFLCAQITAFAGWNAVIKRVWEAMGQFMLVGIVLIGVIVVAVWGHFTHLYHWNTPGIMDPANPLYDKILAGKKGFLNPVFFTVGTVGFLGIWYFWYRNLRGLSIAQDTMETASFDYYKRQRKWAASFLPIAGFLSPVFLWLILMSIDSHWYSTMFAWYSTISMWLGGLAMTTMLLIYLKSRGYLEYVTYDHLHDVGKFLFGISVFWTYLWFDQFMLIWYANIGEETIYFKERMNHYPVLFWGNLLMNFVTPFLILMRNDTKRKFGTMFFVAAIVFFGHWWDFFYMIKPGARIAAHEAMEHAAGSHGSMSHSDVAPIGEASHDDAAAHEATDAHSTPGHSSENPTNEATGEGTQTMPALGEGTTQEPTNDTTPPTQTHADEMASEGAAAAHGDANASPDAEGSHGDEHGAAAHGPDKSFKIGYTLPGFQEIGAMIGFLSLFLFVFFRSLASTSLVPMRDPYLEESLHHNTGALIETEMEAEGHGAHH